MSWNFKSIMASRKEGEYDPLTEDDQDRESADIHVRPRIKSKSKLSTLGCLIVSNTLLALVIVGLLVRNSHQLRKSSSPIPYTGVSTERLLEEQLGLASSVVKTYMFAEEGLDDFDFMKGDPFWAALFPKGGGQVFLDDETVAAYKLPPVLRNPAKGNYSAYMMAGYHSLHCVTGLRQVIGRFVAAHRVGEQYEMPQKTWLHTIHCLADLRQLVLCNIDETLMSIEDETVHPGYHQKKICKDDRPIVEWIEWNYEGKFQ
ncbi:hypothetical protein V8C35DRAFT_317364 [Trichoderma chlorosporum]